MVYLYKKTIKEVPYYYLRLSKRVKDRVVVQDIAYLGNDINDVEKKLDTLNTAHKKKVRKAYRNIKKFLEQEYYLQKVIKKKIKQTPYLPKQHQLQVEAIKLHFQERFLKLDKKTKEEIYQRFIIDFAFNTTSLEGNTIKLEEAQKLLQEHLTPKDKTMREIYDVQNTEKVFLPLLEEKRQLSQELINAIHTTLLENIDPRTGYRAHDIRVFGRGFEASPAKYVKIDMDILLLWFAKHKERLDPLVIAGIFHQKFEKIHPFADGNGRTGRMVLNYILLKEHYPPLIINKKDRARYLEVLGEADKGGLHDLKPGYYRALITFLAEQMIDNYWRNFLV